ncbi:histidine phosphatase family protein [Polynucleobacter sp. JS-Safj-400b-B2]|uniref:histidine phosphatase family protein n=1 Tax=Polynucleobacter sp. JS-Safj-400b-B2 TaxID=2576921 RepID=UPI001C0ABD88|nr:histidine phosphatase family protein [Polynucleobacter sp. JS-Safj-400b-B2]MBU3627064.1 histidine phosphatase family protein [Polynucleobacter sp. JS-Safj-400b-B2]
MNFINILISTLASIAFGLFPLLAHANLASDLNDGQHVLLIRHADAPGYGDPKGYQLDKCTTQRNLGDYGKKQAALIGEWLKNQGITSANLISSPWCRCIDTAKLMNIGSAQISPALGSFFDDMSLEKQQTKELEKLIQLNLNGNNNSKDKVPLILVTHHVNIQAYAGKVVNVGDMVLVKVNKNGQHLSHQIYPSP